jgi:hypothetical protein
MKTKQAKSIVAVLVTVSAIAGAVFFATPRALSVDTVTYVGTQGNYLGHCTVDQCTNSNGCQTFAQKYDWWYAGKTCDGGLVTNGGPGTCYEDFRICRITQEFFFTNCGGPGGQRWIVMRSMCSGGYNEAPPGGG